ncbi:MAG: 4Fe-4S dicluster domain-containing protein, partial [Actinomycetia bacterium]|nr:4Fe-4S dicluster domain-containing protein [Actinomycetes bacterium]
NKPKPLTDEVFEEYPPLGIKNLEKERKRVFMPLNSPEKRKRNYMEIETGFSKEEGVEEAWRCLQCRSQACVGCGFCSRICPDFCIEVERSKPTDKEKIVNKYNLDLQKCMFCGLCEEICPTNTITLSREYEVAYRTREQFNFDKEKLVRKERY